MESHKTVTEPTHSKIGNMAKCFEPVMNSLEPADCLVMMVSYKLID